MLEGKKGTDKWFPVILTDDSDFKTAETGKAFGDVTCKYSYEAATGLSTHTVTTDEWKEAGEGKYWLRIGASEFTSEGKYEVSITVAGCLTFNFPVEVRDKTVAENMDDIDTIKAKTDLQPAGIPKNVAFSNFGFLMVLSSDHITPAIGKTLTAQISKDGGVFAACTNTATEIGSGVYKINFTQTEMNADFITVKFIGTDCDQRTVSMRTSA